MMVLTPNNGGEEVLLNVLPNSRVVNSSLDTKGFKNVTVANA